MNDVSDFHCVTTWSQFDMEWEGVAFFTIADLVKPRPEASPPDTLNIALRATREPPGA